MTGKISVKNPESLRHYAEGIQAAKRYEKKTIDIKQCMEETAEIIEKWRRDKFSYLTDFFFCPDKPDHSIARAFLYDVTYDSLVILKTRFNGSLEGFNMKVPSDFTTKALSSYRSSDVDTKPSIDVNKNVVLSSRYTYQNEEENSTNVMDMQYTPALPPEFIVDAEMTEEQLIKKLNSFNIGLNVRELDTIDQAVVTQLFTMISGENIGETYISCDFKDFVQRVTRTARPRKANLDDIAERLQKLKYLGYSYTEYDQETGDIKTQASIGFINSVNIDRANNILTFSPSAEWKNQYVTNSYIQIDSESYEKINSYQTRAILMLLQQERLANFAKGITATTLSMKFFRTHMKLIKVQNSMFVRELENHLRTLQSEGIVVEDYEFRRKNTSVKIYFTHLTEMEKIAVLTHWVADNIRYAGISMGKGEGYTLHNTKMNYTDRCGVCKDIAGTLISFLRMAGFEAYPAMTMAGSRVESIPADHFNHCVAVVKLSNGTYMPLDPTWVPFCRELWSSAEQQQNYLPGVPEGSDLCLTPVSAPENHYFRIKADNRLDADGTLRGTFTVTAEGQSDSNIRRIFTTGFQSEWKNTMERQLLAVSPKARLLSVDYGRNPKDYQSAPIKITFRYEIPDYALKGKDMLCFHPMVMNNLYNQVRSYLRIDTGVKERKYGFKDACSRLVELDETIQLPAGYKMANSDRNDNVEGCSADFEGSLAQKGNKIFLYNKLALKKRVYEASDWDNYRDAVNAHKTYGDYLVIKK